MPYVDDATEAAFIAADRESEKDIERFCKEQGISPASMAFAFGFRAGFRTAHPTWPAASPRSRDDPLGIMSGLTAALQAWRPNLIQILISEVQNVLEVDALAMVHRNLQRAETQTALLYYLLCSIERFDFESPLDLTIPVVALIDKILDSVRQKLVSDECLLTLASKALVGSLRETQWISSTWPENHSKLLFDAAVNLAQRASLRWMMSSSS
jgi:hypothetical protein